jgi:hypothetical protein
MRGVLGLVLCFTAQADPVLVGQESVVPQKLAVKVYAHELGSLGSPASTPCWTYVSDGLWPLGQKEILFSVARRPGEASYPRELLLFYAELHQLASKHRLVGHGDITQLGSDGPSLLGDFRGVVYTAAPDLPGVRVAAPHLTGVLVKAEELQAVASLGSTRLLGRLGQRARYYPFPPYAERGRPTLMSPHEESLVAKTQSFHAATATVWQDEKARVKLRLREAVRQLAKIPPERPLTLLTGIDPESSAALVWSPGQKAPAAITAGHETGPHLAGSFVMFVPQQDEDGAQMFEDGFAVFVRDQTWKRLRQALVDGKPLSVPASGDKMSFEMVAP